MSEEKPKGRLAPPPRPAAAPEAPPKLERVAPGYQPPASVRSPSAAAPAPAPSPQPSHSRTGAPSPQTRAGGTQTPPPPARAGGTQTPSPPARAGGTQTPSPPASAGGEGRGEGAASPKPPVASYGLAAREVGADAAIAAGLAHEGTLANESALRLFALAAALHGNGRLTISTEGKTYALSFRRGTVEHAASSDREDDLGRFLVARGAITEAQRAQAETAKPRHGGDLAAALVGERLVNPGDVAGRLQERGAALVQRALAVESGGWSWEPDASPPPSSFPLGAPFAMLCGAVRALDAVTLQRRLGDRESRAASRIGARIRIEDLRLTAQEMRAAGLFDGARSPAEIAAVSPADTVLVLRVALLLAEVDLLAFGAARKVAVPAPAPPAKAAAPPRPAPSPQPSPAARAGGEGAKATAPRPATTPPPRPATTPPPRPAPIPASAPAPLERAALEALAKKLASADHFEVLGLKREAQAAHFKAAYFSLAKTYHPDAVPATVAADVRKLCADVFAKVSEAWSVLGEDASRAAYLEELRTGGKPDVDVANIFEAETTFESATLLVKARRYDEALAKIEQAIQLHPEAEYSMWKSWCEFLLTADKKKALPVCGGATEAALKRNPRCTKGYVFLGQMAKLAGDLALAERQLKRGLAVAPEDAELLRELKYLKK